MKTIAAVLAVLVLVRVQAAPEASPSIPEIEAYRGPYVRNLAAIEAARQTRTENIRKAYGTDLDRLQKEITTTGDLDGALQVNAERERFTAGKDPTAIERKAMGPQLAALRTRYERDVQPILEPLRAAEDQQKRAYLAALDDLQRKFTTQNQLDKASVVRNERNLIAGVSATNAAPATPAAITAPLSPSAVAGAGKLDPAFAAKIAAAVSAKELAKTETSRAKGTGGDEAPSEGAVLVGFEFFETKSNRTPDIRSLRPIYLTADGVKEGNDRGKMEKITNKVIARPGFAVGGIYVWHTNDDGRIQGLQVVFMKMLPGEARLDRSASNTYKSLWYGSIPHKEKPKELGGDGRAVVGVHGFHGADCDTIGLIQMAK